MSEPIIGKPPTDGNVQVAPDGAGKRLDNSVVVQDDGTTVYRERLNLSDPVDPNAHARIQDYINGLEQGLVTRDIYAEKLLNSINLLIEEIKQLRTVMELHTGIEGGD